MNRQSLLVVVLLLVAAGLGWLAFGSRTGPALPVDVSESPSTPTNETGAAPFEAPPAARVEAAPTRRVDATDDAAPPPADPRLEDPEIRAALTGYRGRIVDSKFQPLADRVVQLWRVELQTMIESVARPGSPITEPEFLAAQVRTGSNGRFEMNGIWPTGVFLVIADAGGEVPTFQAVEQTPGPGEVADLGDIALRDAATLTGIVVDADGAPVPNALVRATDLPAAALAFVPLERFDPRGALIVREQRSGTTTATATTVVEFPGWVQRTFDQLPIPSTRSDAEGRFRLTGVEASAVMMVVTEPRHASHVASGIRLRPGETRDVGKVQLSSGESAVGRVVDSNREPIPGAEVLVAQTSSSAPIDFAVRGPTTDADGRFEWPGIGGGKATVAVRRDRESPWHIVGPQSTSTDFEITLPARATLTVEVVDEHGAAIPDPRVDILPNAPESGIDAYYAFGFARMLDLRARASRNESGHLVVRDLEVGHYGVAAGATGRTSVSEQVKLDADKVHRITLPASSAFTVQVVDANGKPIRNASILGTGPRDTNDFPRRVGLTSADGRCMVDVFEAGQVTLVASHPKYGSVSRLMTLPGDVPPLVLQTPATIECFVTDKGAPPVPGEWTVSVSLDWSAERALPLMPRLATPGADGRVVITGLQPGAYTVTAISSLRKFRSPGSLQSMFFDFFGGADEQASAECTLAGGSREIVRLDVGGGPGVETGPSAAVRGIVTVNGTPVSGARVITHERRRRTAVTDASGRFDLGRLPVGEHWVHIGDPGAGAMSPLWSGRWTIVENKDLDVELHIAAGSMSGRVYDANGTPAAGVTVEVGATQTVQVEASGEATESTSTSYQHYHTTTDRDGRFELARVVEGSYSLRFEHDEHGKAKLEGVEIRGAAARSGLDARLARGFVVKGRIDMGAFGATPPEYVSLSLSLNDGSDYGHAIVQNSDGQFEIKNLSAGTYAMYIHVETGTEASTEVGSWVVADPELKIDGDRAGVLIKPVFRRHDAPRETGK